MDRNTRGVIGTPPPIESASPDDRLERWRIPVLIRPGGLDIMVGIEHYRWRTGARFAARHHSGLPSSVAVDTDVVKESHLHKQLLEQAGTGLECLGVEAIPRHRRNTNEACEVCDKARSARAKLGDHRLAFSIGKRRP